MCPGSKIRTCQVPNACKNCLLLTKWQVNLSGTDILYIVELNFVCIYIYSTHIGGILSSHNSFRNHWNMLICCSRNIIINVENSSAAYNHETMTDFCGFKKTFLFPEIFDE